MTNTQVALTILAVSAVAGCIIFGYLIWIVRHTWLIGDNQ